MPGVMRFDTLAYAKKLKAAGGCLMSKQRYRPRR
jgi:hypothetical protein